MMVPPSSVGADASAVVSAGVPGVDGAAGADGASGASGTVASRAGVVVPDPPAWTCSFSTGGRVGVVYWIQDCHSSIRTRPSATYRISRWVSIMTAVSGTIRAPDRNPRHATDDI